MLIRMLRKVGRPAKGIHLAETASKSDTASVRETREMLMKAALPHVPNTGWTDRTFRSAANDSGIELVRARAACSRGALDLAWEFHAAGDDRMVEEAGKADFSALKFRDRISEMVFLRLESMEDDKEVVRRCMSLYALPQYALEGARALWTTSDRIWTHLGDPSSDLNWYTKRASLSAVIGSATLHWLGDASDGNFETRSFIDRRIDEVMKIEKAKASLRNNPAFRPFAEGIERFARSIRAPRNRRGANSGSANGEAG